jgi:hypothetical protein
MTAMRLCEIWGVYCGKKAYCSPSVMKPYSLVSRYQHLKVTYVIISLFLQNGGTRTLLQHKTNQPFEDANSVTSENIVQNRS